MIDYLVFKKEGEDGPEVKGGTMDALIIHATKVQKKSDGKQQNHFILYNTLSCSYFRAHFLHVFVHYCFFCTNVQQ